MLARLWRNRNLPTMLVGMYNGTATLENNLVVLKKLNIELLYNPAVPLLGIDPKDLKIDVLRNSCIQVFMAILSQ